MADDALIYPHGDFLGMWDHMKDKTNTREKFSRIYKSDTIVTEILYCLGLVHPTLSILQ